MIPYYIVTARGTIEQTGVVQDANLGSVNLDPGERIFVGVAVAGQHYYANGFVLAYTPEQLQLLRKSPGAGFQWDATQMAWVDGRGLAQTQLAKLTAAQIERDRRASLPLIVNGITVAADPSATQRALLVVSMNPGLGIGLMRWQDAFGTIQTFPSAGAYRLFVTAVGQAIAAQVASADGWLWDIQSQIRAAATPAAVNAITW